MYVYLPFCASSSSVLWKLFILVILFLCFGQGSPNVPGGDDGRLLGKRPQGAVQRGRNATNKGQVPCSIPSRPNLYCTYYPYHPPLAFWSFATMLLSVSRRFFTEHPIKRGCCEFLGLGIEEQSIVRSLGSR